MRIWVARPQPAAGRTAERLRRLGHDPLVAPVLAVVPTGQPISSEPCDAVLLTSANAARALANAGIEAPVFAVGPRTAEAARRAGFADVRAAGGHGPALAELVRGSLPAGARLLHVAGEDRKAEPAASLERAGFALTVWVAYAAKPVEALPVEIARALDDASGQERIAAALHYSRRSAAVAMTLACAAGYDVAFRALKHYCLSNDVAVPLVEAGILANFVPARPDEDSLLAALARVE